MEVLLARSLSKWRVGGGGGVHSWIEPVQSLIM